MFRKQLCKHAHFICERIMKIQAIKWINSGITIDSVNEYITRNLSHLISNTLSTEYKETLNTTIDMKKKPHEKEIVARNIASDCAICLEELKNQIVICSSCLNGIHDICWKKWKSIKNRNTTCIYCRKLMKIVSKEKEEDDHEGGVDQFGNVVLKNIQRRMY